MKGLCLVLLGLVAAKAAASLGAPTKGFGKRVNLLAVIQGLLLAVILGLAIRGAWFIGNDLAAESYDWASRDNLAHRQTAKAYENALRAVASRPGILPYWRTLSRAKFLQQQFRSALADLPAFMALGGNRLEEEDAARFALCHFYRGEYGQVLTLTQTLIERNRYYPLPYVLQGAAYTEERKFAEAEHSFLNVLQMFPTQQAAVEGLAHVYYLEGDRGRALRVLNETSKFAFPPEARKRFEDLKALYAQ